MVLNLAYRGRSTISPDSTVVLAPNLARDPVGFSGTLRHASPFREALAAFTEIIVGHPPRPRRKPVAARSAAIAVPEEIERDFRRQKARYWAARRKHADLARDNDPVEWRRRLPCDPVLTVAADAVLLEGFAADESTYACLTVDRNAFEDEGDARLGTTNVDLSPAFVGRIPLLVGRETRLVVDSETSEGDRNEQVAVPSRWLRSFLRVQSSMGLPGNRVSLGQEGLYDVLTFLGRIRRANGFKGMWFDLRRGRPDRPVLNRGSTDSYTDSVLVESRDPLRSLAPLLPFVDAAYLDTFGDGEPTFWSVRMGGVRLTLGFSGWTSRDLMGPARFDQLAPPVAPGRFQLGQVAASFRANPSQTLAEVVARSGGSEAEALACLHELAGIGRVLHDIQPGLYRWREWARESLTTEVIGPEDPETIAGRQIAATTSVNVTRCAAQPDGSSLIEGDILGLPISIVTDSLNRLIRGKCSCSHFAVHGLRNGPCRHLQAVCWLRSIRQAPSSLADWLAGLRMWSSFNSGSGTATRGSSPVDASAAT